MEGDIFCSVIENAPIVGRNNTPEFSWVDAQLGVRVTLFHAILGPRVITVSRSACHYYISVRVSLHYLI